MKTSRDWNREIAEMQEAIERADARGDYDYANRLREQAKIQDEEYMQHKQRQQSRTKQSYSTNSSVDDGGCLGVIMSLILNIVLFIAIIRFIVWLIVGE